jgi:hypothetical protein
MGGCGGRRVRWRGGGWVTEAHKGATGSAVGFARVRLNFLARASIVLYIITVTVYIYR